MPIRRFPIWGLMLAAGTLAIAGCEPYMSMTDQVPSRTHRAAALLPEAPQYVGMIDVATALQQVEALSGARLVDSLRQADHPYLRPFLETTAFDPRTDVEAVYGATVGEAAFSAVVFGSLTAQQMDRYLERAPAGAGRATTYRDVPLYHLALAPNEADTLSVAFVGEGTMAVARSVDQVTAMVDRSRAAQGGLRSNDAYMTLVQRVGRGSTAWLVGRNVVETALQDSSGATTAGASPGSETPQVNRAGVQDALAEWADRVLGLSGVSSFDGRTGEQLGRLARRLREQAFSIRLTESAMEGEAFLTMRDEATASSVVDLAEGAVAVLKLSADRLDERHRDLLDGVQIEREGAIVHVRFSLDRDMLRERVRDRRRAAVGSPSGPSARSDTTPPTLLVRSVPALAPGSEERFRGSPVPPRTSRTTDRIPDIFARVAELSVRR